MNLELTRGELSDTMNIKKSTNLKKQESSAMYVSPVFARTPVEKLRDDEQFLGNEIYIKRDDLLPYGLGGNKVRIAAEYLEDMKRQGKDAMIMYGDLRSNLCRVLANMCAADRIPMLMIATKENERQGEIPFNTRLIRFFGADIRICEKTRIAEAVDQAMDELKGKGLSPYYIYGDRTGSGNEGTAARAYAKAGKEVSEYERENHLVFDRIFVPYGTGSTQGGLAAGFAERGEDRCLTGISISSRGEERAKRILALTAEGYFKKEGKPVPDSLSGYLNLACEYTEGGYGCESEAVLELIRSVLIKSSVPLDPTYTGKAFYGMLRYLKDHGITGKKILYWHTGGTPLFYDAAADILRMS